MMKLQKRSLCLVLALIMALGTLTACGGNGDDDPKQTNVPGAEEYVYVPEFKPIEMPEGASYMNASALQGDTLYFATECAVGYRIVTSDAEGNLSYSDIIPGPVPEEDSGVASDTDLGTGEVDVPATETDIDAESAARAAGAIAVEPMPMPEPMPAPEGFEGSWNEVVYETALFAMSLKSGEVKRLEDFKLDEVPEQTSTSGGYVDVSSMSVDAEGNIWVVENCSSYYLDLPAGMTADDPNAWNYYKNEDHYYLIKCSHDTGAELSRLDLAELLSSGNSEYYNYFYVRSFVLDKEGYAYLMAMDDICVLSPKGELLFKVKAQPEDGSRYTYELLTMNDGRVFAYGYKSDNNSGTNMLWLIDREKKDYGEELAAPVNAGNFRPGFGDYAFCYDNGDALYGYKLESGESEKILSWINSDVDSGNLTNVLPMEDGTVVAIANYWDNSYSENTNELVTMVRKPASEVPQKTVLTYACMYLDYNMRREILKFNRSSTSNVRIEVKDYSEYATEEDYAHGLTVLANDITSGYVPDIFAVNNLPVDRYAAKGLIEDLLPYLEADTALGGRDAMVGAVLNALMTDGKLYKVCSGFEVISAIALADVVGNKPGWTLDELKAAYATLPQGASVMSRYMTKNNILNYMLMMNIDDFIDWDTGKCSFDSQQFIDILRFTELFPAEYNDDDQDYVYVPTSTALKEGSQLMNIFSLYSLDDFVWEFGADLTPYTFIGLPSPDGSSRNYITCSNGLAMSSTCKDKDAAWQFMRTMLTREYQESSYNGIPVSKAVFDAKIKEMTTIEYYTDTDDEGNKQPKTKYYYYDESTGEEIEYTHIEQETVDKILALIDSASRTFNYGGESINQMVIEAAAPYLAGQRSAEDVAREIQSSMTLYVNEQR